jgi:hypothetical protein
MSWRGLVENQLKFWVGEFFLVYWKILDLGLGKELK